MDTKVALSFRELPEAQCPICKRWSVVYRLDVKVVGCSRCWADWVAKKELQEREYWREVWKQSRLKLHELPKSDSEEKDIDPRSPEFQAKVRAVFDRELKYGDGPIDFSKEGIL